jgi:hypothetical protein
MILYPVVIEPEEEEMFDDYLMEEEYGEDE